jgi:hypothetical protein
MHRRTHTQACAGRRDSLLQNTGLTQSQRTVQAAENGNIPVHHGTDNSVGLEKRMGENGKVAKIIVPVAELTTQAAQRTAVETALVAENVRRAAVETMTTEDRSAQPSFAAGLVRQRLRRDLALVTFCRTRMHTRTHTHTLTRTYAHTWTWIDACTPPPMHAPTYTGPHGLVIRRAGCRSRQAPHANCRAHGERQNVRCRCMSYSPYVTPVVRHAPYHMSHTYDVAHGNACHVTHTWRAIHTA